MNAPTHSNPPSRTLTPLNHRQAAADAKFADYKPTTAFLFPGQGAQSVGMAKVRQGEGHQ
jgi:acyl transferase domain-containing protein